MSNEEEKKTSRQTREEWIEEGYDMFHEARENGNLNAAGNIWEKIGKAQGYLLGEHEKNEVNVIIDKIVYAAEKDIKEISALNKRLANFQAEKGEDSKGKAGLRGSSSPTDDGTEDTSDSRTY